MKQLLYALTQVSKPHHYVPLCALQLTGLKALKDLLTLV
jgi:hypothetical protein